VALRVGTSTNSDASSAAREAVVAARSGCESPVFALVFATLDHRCEDIAAAVSASLGSIPWAGCSTPGLLTQVGFLRSGVAVGIIDAKAVKVGIGLSPLDAFSGREAGRVAATAALASLPAPPTHRGRAMVLLCDSRDAASTDVVRGASAVAGAGVAWAGGGTGATGVQFFNGKCHVHTALAIAFDFPSRAGTGIHHGWVPFGPPAMITAASGTVVRQLEYQNAFDTYRTIVEGSGESVTRETFAAFSMAHPLGIPQATGEHLIRDPMLVEPDGSIRCAAEVPDGALVRVMRGTPDALIAAAGKAAELARDDTAGPLGGAFIFDCVSRFGVLGDAIDLELAAFKGAFGEGVPFLGCLSYGEVGAFGSCVPQFHNKTAIVLGFPR